MAGESRAVLHVAIGASQRTPCSSCASAADAHRETLAICSCTRTALRALRFASSWVGSDHQSDASPKLTLSCPPSSPAGFAIDASALISSHLSSIDAQPWPDGSAVFAIPGMAAVPSANDESPSSQDAAAAAPALAGFTYIKGSFCPDAVLAASDSASTDNLHLEMIQIASYLASALCTDIRTHLGIEVSAAVAPSPLLARLAVIAHQASSSRSLMHRNHNHNRIHSTTSTPIPVVVFPDCNSRMARKLVDKADIHSVLASEPSALVHTLLTRARQRQTQSQTHPNPSNNDKTHTSFDKPINNTITAGQIRHDLSNKLCREWLGQEPGDRCWNLLSGIDHSSIVATGPLPHITVAMPITHFETRPTLVHLASTLIEICEEEETHLVTNDASGRPGTPHREWKRYATVLEITITNKTVLACPDPPSKSVLAPTDIYDLDQDVSARAERLVDTILLPALESLSDTHTNASSSSSRQASTTVTVSLSEFSPTPPRASIKAFFKGLVGAGNSLTSTPTITDTHPTHDDTAALLSAASIDPSVYTALPHSIQQQILADCRRSVIPPTATKPSPQHHVTRQSKPKPKRVQQASQHTGSTNHINKKTTPNAISKQRSIPQPVATHSSMTLDRFFQIK